MQEYLTLFHWSFFCVTLIVAALTEFLKRAIQLLPQNKWVKLFAPMRILPLIFGGLIGLIPDVPAPEMVGGSSAGIGHVLYFASAGILSAWVYSLAKKLFEDILPTELKQFVEKRLGTEGDPPDQDEGIQDDTRG